MALRIRAMEAGDIPAIARLAKEGFSNTYRFDWESNARSLYDAAAAGRVFVAVAEWDGQVVGYGNLRARPAGGWIDQIVVLQAYRRQGVGRALLEAVIAEAAVRKFWKVSLITRADDPVSRPFFERLAWEGVGTMRDEIKKGIDGVLLSRIVDYRLHPNKIS